MTNSKVLQYIISELGKSSLSWEGDKELFELIFAPIPYGNDTYQQRQSVKSAIEAIFFGHSAFDKNRFQLLADNIVCGEAEQKYREELLDFITIQIKEFGIQTDIDIVNLIQAIPGKGEDEKNYKNSFNNWKNGHTKKINSQTIKRRLEKNFDFSHTLWDKGDVFIKSNLKLSVEKFVKQQTNEINDLFEELRREFDVEKGINNIELEVLESIRHMTQVEVMKFISDHYPLSKFYSQEFIQKMIPILYAKGFYELLLHDVIEALDVHLQELNSIKKIKAHILGSPVIGEYLQAFNLLSSISSDNEAEIIDMKTEAISNIFRYQLSDNKIDKTQKKEIVQKIVTHYKTVFEDQERYHYYPAINLTYTMLIEHILNGNLQQINSDINILYEKTKPSIVADQKSNNKEDKYYANVTDLEFLLLQGKGNPIAELERFLELHEEEIKLIELGRTQRQMQFFVDIIIQFDINSSIVDRMRRSIDIIDDFIDYKSEKEN